MHHAHRECVDDNVGIVVRLRHAQDGDLGLSLRRGIQTHAYRTCLPDSLDELDDVGLCEGVSTDTPRFGVNGIRKVLRCDEDSGVRRIHE